MNINILIKAPRSLGASTLGSLRSLRARWWHSITLIIAGPSYRSICILRLRAPGLHAVSGSHSTRVLATPSPELGVRDESTCYTLWWYEQYTNIRFGGTISVSAGDHSLAGYIRSLNTYRTRWWYDTVFALYNAHAHHNAHSRWLLEHARLHW